MTIALKIVDRNDAARRQSLGSKWRLAVACSGLYLLLHSVALAVFAGHAKFSSYLFLIVAPLLASATCIFCAHATGLRLKWYSAAMGLALWSAGMAANMYMELFAPGGGVVSGLATLLFVLYGVPLTFIAGSPASTTWPARLTDAAMALALGCLFFFYTFTFATVNNATDAGILNIRTLYDVQNALVLCFFGVRYIISDGGPQRNFFRGMTIFAGSYLLSAAYINHIEINSDFGEYPDLVIDIPFLLIAALAIDAGTREARAAHWRVSQNVSAVIDAACPLWLPLTLFAISCFLIFKSPWLAVGGFLAALAGHGTRGILLELQSKSENRRLQQLSRIDPLTQIFNRRTFDETLVGEFRRAARSRHPLSLLMVDIDHFKSINDTFGHPEGDRYLREVSRILAALASRAGDVVARYGGEEFAIILPAVDADAASQVADKILGAVVGLALPSPATRGVVTVSIGQASLDSSTFTDEAQMLKAADAALYQAKHSGRNRAVRFGTSPSSASAALPAPMQPTGFDVDALK